MHQILLIEDDEIVAEIIASIFGEDFTVRIARDGQEGLALAWTALPPDLILLDIHLPVIDGYEVCRRFKANPATAAIPVIFLTSLTSPDDESQGFAAGAVDYIHKPCNPALVRARVKTHLSLRQAQRELLRQQQQILELERRESAREIAQLNRRLEYALAATGEGIWDFDLTTGEVQHNAQWCRLLGLDDSYLSHPLAEFIALVHPQDRDAVTQRVHQALTGSGSYVSEHRLLSRDGRLLWALDRGHVVERDAQGQALRMVGSFSDITERKHWEAALVESEARFRALADAAPVLIWMTGRQGRFLWFNQRWLDFTGRTLEQEAGEGWFTGVHVEDFDRCCRIHEECFAARRPFSLEFRLRRHDGRYRWLLHTGVPRHDEQGEFAGFIGSCIDVTERREIERALEESERDLSAILSNLPSMVGCWDRQQHCRFANQAYQAWFGVPPETIRGRHVRELLGEDLYQLNRSHIEAALAGVPQEFERAIPRPDGQGVRYALAHYIPDTQDGEVRGFYSLVSDITAQKEAQQLLIAARNEAERANQAKSDFLAMMSHELRTPMTGVIGMADFLIETALDRDQRLYVEIMRSSAETLLTILNDILDFSKIDAERLELERLPFDAVALGQETVQLFRPKAEDHGTRLVLDSGGLARLPLLGDPLRLKQVLSNLVGNAVKFTRQGQVTVRLRHQLEDGRCDLTFEVEDTGIGIAPAEQARLFQPFSQAEAGTSRKFGGTGLGLAICKRLVALMGGEIGLSSSPGVGSSFRFSCRLDLAPPEAARRPPPPPLPAAVAIRPLTILVVEDNDLNRMIVRIGLERRGHRVVLVANGREAVAAVAAQPFDLVLMDLQMPELSGTDATRQIRTLASPCARVPIVALTADAVVGHRAAYLAAGLDDVLTKPIQWPQLDDVLARFQPAAAVATLPAPAGAPAGAPAPDHGPVPAGPAQTIPFSDDLDQLFALDESPPSEVWSPLGGGDSGPFGLERALERVDGDRELLQLLFRSFHDHFHQAGEELSRLVATGQLEQAHRLAHIVKGAAASLEATALVELAAELERVLRPADLPALCRDFQAALAQALSAARRYRGRDGA